MKYWRWNLVWKTSRLINGSQSGQFIFLERNEVGPFPAHFCLKIILENIHQKLLVLDHGVKLKDNMNNPLVQKKKRLGFDLGFDLGFVLSRFLEVCYNVFRMFSKFSCSNSLLWSLSWSKVPSWSILRTVILLSFSKLWSSDILNQFSREETLILRTLISESTLFSSLWRFCKTSSCLMKSLSLKLAFLSTTSSPSFR